MRHLINMESQSSAKSLLSLFSKSDLSTFTPMTSRDFYKTSPPPNASTVTEDQVSPEHDRPRKKRRRSGNPSEWTCIEIRALETYRNLSKKGEFDDGLRDVLLPNRTNEEVQAQLARVENTIRKKRASRKLEDLEKEESELFVLEERHRMEEMVKDIKQRRLGLDNVLGLDELSAGNGSTYARSVRDTRESKYDTDVKSSLDQALGLGLVEESAEQRLKRELDEALGLR